MPTTFLESPSASPPSAKTALDSVSLAGKYLTFFLADEEYGLEILKAQEIIGFMNVTPIPRAPDYVKGVINLRGKIIPVIELRTRFNLATAACTGETCIIVVQTSGMQVGIIVDKVSEVLDIAGADIENAPSFGAGGETDFILGIGKAADRVRLLLDIDRILNKEDLSSLSNEPPT
jgi:purine-binding chemotaxis protein CheW